VTFFAGLFNNLIVKPVLRPVFRVISGLVAIPVFRFVLRRVFRVQTTNPELERDLENWFRGAVLLLAATANLEDMLFGWLPWHHNNEPWLTMLLRLLLAIGVIENMPDQDLFAFIHRGPPKFRLSKKSGWQAAWRRKVEIFRGLGVLHLRRSSPVFVIMTVVFGGGKFASGDWLVGWICYGLAILQYLIIALVTDRDRVAGLLRQLEKSSDAIREELFGDSSATPPPQEELRRKYPVQ
jgi:hypothetical protein